MQFNNVPAAESSTTSRTTTYRSTTHGPFVGTPTVTSYTSHPVVSQYSMTTSSGGMTPGTTFTTVPPMLSANYFGVIQPPLISPIAAPMNLVSAPMTIAPPTNKQLKPNATFTNSASLTLNGVRCEGMISISDTAIVEGRNIFVGVAPFVLSGDTLEVTPEFTVVTRNPDIRFHLAQLPTPEFQSLTIAQLRGLAGIQPEQDMYIGLPGQCSSLIQESSDGSFVLKSV